MRDERTPGWMLEASLAPLLGTSFSQRNNHSDAWLDVNVIKLRANFHWQAEKSHGSTNPNSVIFAPRKMKEFCWLSAEALFSILWLWLGLGASVLRIYKSTVEDLSGCSNRSVERLGTFRTLSWFEHPQTRLWLHTVMLDARILFTLPNERAVLCAHII